MHQIVVITQFIFDVTIQNHGGYTDSLNMPVTFDLSNYGSFEDAAIFFSLMKISDNAFKELVEYFSNIETPTMIILFGDHQPTLSLNTEAWLYNNTTQNTEINNLNKNSLIHNARGAGRKAKFTDDQVDEIRRLREDGNTIKEIANRYNCSVGLIHKLINEK